MTGPTSRPRFSIVSAAYQVGRYLPDFIASIEELDFDLSRVEVVVVDDGSTDETAGLLDAWAQRRPGLVRVVHQENAGQAAARNAGMAVATGEWITFPDPDDVLDRKYLRVAERFLTAHPQAAMLATERVIWQESTGERTRTHPLRGMFRGNQLIDLEASGLHFHNSAAAAFFPLDRVRELDLHFDPELRPNFEDGHFVGRFLLLQDRPQVGFLRRAAYYYRKREDGTSTLQTSLQHPGRYTTVFERGYQGLIDLARQHRGGIPRWLGSLLGYEIATYLIAAETHGGAKFLAEGPEVDALHANIAALLELPEVRESMLQVRYPVSRTVRLAMLHGYRGEDWVDDHVALDSFDERTGLVRARYFFVGEQPAETVVVGGSPAEPAHAKTRDLRYLGRVLLRERILWAPPKPDLSIRTGERWQHLAAVRPAFDQTVIAPFWVQQQLGTPPGRLLAEWEQFRPEPTTEEGRRGLRAAGSRRAAREFADAWVFVDKIHEGNDNAEHLFRHVRRHHPEINAFFVVTKGSVTWERLRREGHGRRLVAHGGTRWRALMVHCRELLSSHCELAIVAPPEIVEITRPRWRFTFLQHGVTKDDMALWLGRRPIDVLVTTTRDEHASIAGDGNGYPFTDKEVRLTGMPRLDSLLAAASSRAPQDRSVLLVAPTWRDWLVVPLAPGKQRRELTDDALDTPFARAWHEFLTSPALAEAAREHGLEVVFLPHPNIEPIVTAMDLPAHVGVATYGTADLQDLFSRTRLLVTDYSSVAFDLAYVDSAVVYYQFDEALVRSAHSTAQGYFDYRRDGFGPVAEDLAAAEDAVRTALAHRPGPAEPYRTRAQEAFGDRDGGCCERVVQVLLGGTESP